MKIKHYVLVGILGAHALGDGARAEEIPSLAELTLQIQRLQQQLKVLERKEELAKEAGVEKSKTTPVVSLGAGGLQVRSADTNFVFKLRGYTQIDSRIFLDDHAAGTANDSFLVRRARPIIEGTVYEKYDYRLMLEFASGAGSSGLNNGFLQDGSVTARFHPGFQLVAGKMKEPVGLERLQSGANLLFIERGHPTQLLPNRDVGFQVQGDVIRETLRYEAGVFNGVADGSSGDLEGADDDKDVAGRIFARPFRNGGNDWVRGLGIGIAGTIGDQESAGAPTRFRSPGQQTFFSYHGGAGTAAAPSVRADGILWRVSPQLHYYRGPFGLFGEYAISDQALSRVAGGASAHRVRNTAWQLAGSYVLTGEENAWRGIVPRSPFSLQGGGWGAWEVAARVGGLDVDDRAFPLLANPNTSASSAFSWGLEINWHLNRNIKLSLNYDQTDFEGGSSEFLSKGEKLIASRAQFSF